MSYLIAGSPNPIGLTETELSEDALTHERLLEIVNAKGTSVHYVKKDENNYGEFYFFFMSGRNWTLSGYGMGEHDQRQMVIRNWRINEYNNRYRTVYAKNACRLEKWAAQNLLKRAKDDADSIPDPKRTREGSAFHALAELADDDFASVHLEELGEEDFEAAADIGEEMLAEG